MGEPVRRWDRGGSLGDGSRSRSHVPAPFTRSGSGGFSVYPFVAAPVVALGAVEERRRFGLVVRSRAKNPALVIGSGQRGMRAVKRGSHWPRQ